MSELIFLTSRERQERRRLRAQRAPPLGIELVRILEVPRVALDGVRRDGHDGAAGNEDVVDAQPFGRRGPREAAGDRGAQAEQLVDDVVEVGDVLNAGVAPVGEAGREDGVEERLEFCEYAALACEVVDGVGQDGGGGVAAGDDDQARVFVEGDLAGRRGAVVVVARFEEPGDEVLGVLIVVEGL